MRMICKIFEHHDQTKLWTAPELLRQSSESKCVAATPKGDIFAFSIIVHEIAERSGPWSTNINQLEPQEIVNNIIHQGTHFFLSYLPLLFSLLYDLHFYLFFEGMCMISITLFYLY